MKLAAQIVTAIVAALHVYFLVLEMFLWTTPLGVKTFGRTRDFMVATKQLAANQGLYNGFLAAGLAWSLSSGALDVRYFFLACVAIAGVFGAATASSRILFVQAVPAAIAIALTLAGCGHAAGATITPAAKPPAPSPLPGFARADLVVLHDGVIDAYAAGDSLVKLGTLPFHEHDTLQGGWADRDHLVVLRRPYDVMLITRDAITPLHVPDKAQLVAPKPEKYDEGLEAGEDGDLVVTPGMATWSRCSWGYPYDGFQCEVWTHAELWPEPGIRFEKERLGEVAQKWPDAAPSGFVAAKGEHAVTCQAPNAAKTIIEASREQDRIMDAIWVSLAPPQLLVVYGEPGYADILPTSWTLHDGCTVAPIAHGRHVEPGPDGLWIADVEDGDHVKRVVYRGARVLGEVSDDAIAFRPH